MTLIERAAEAIWREDRALTGKMGLQWKNVTTGEKAYYRTFARAVLQAIREPGEDTVESGAKAGVDQIYYKKNAWVRCIDDEFKPDHLNYARFAWQAMIDAMLAEGLPTDLP